MKTVRQLKRPLKASDMRADTRDGAKLVRAYLCELEISGHRELLVQLHRLKARNLNTEQRALVDEEIIYRESIIRVQQMKRTSQFNQVPEAFR